MSAADLILSQLADPFRIGLLIALFITMLRTEAATGTWVPLAVGALFVAVLLPLTVPGTAVAVPLVQAVVSGLVANVILLAIILAAWRLYQRRRG